MPLLLDASPAPRLSPDAPVRLAAAGPLLWRVIDHSGRVIGHLEASDSEGSVRFRARRFHRASRMLRDLGEFWSADDAVDCLRFVR